MFSRRQFLKFLGMGAASLGALGFYAFEFEPLLRLTVARYALTPPNWPPGLKLRLVALADLHACDPWMTLDRLAAIRDMANGLGGDLILLLGDYMSGMRLSARAIPAEEWAPVLGGLRAPMGVHAIAGNHDWWEDPDAQRRGGGDTKSHRALRAAGIPVYANRAARLEKDGHVFWLAGLEDQLAIRRRSAGRRRETTGLDDLPGTLARIGDAAPVILMAHEPDIFPMVPARVSLTLSGHTHGGQVRIGGYAPIVPSRYGNRFVHGHIVEQGRHLIVSGGLGCSLLPVRLGAPPEIVVVDLG